MLEEELSRARQPSPRPAPEEGEPTIDKFQDFDQYVAAKAAYIARRTIESTLTEREQRQQAERFSEHQSRLVTAWQERVAKATEEIPDFEEVVSSSSVPMTEPMQQAIMESDVGHKLAYYLAQHPDEATEIARMSPSGAIRTLGRIEERLLVAKPTVSKPLPPPLKPLGGTASVKKSPAQMTDEEYAKWRKRP